MILRMIYCNKNKFESYVVVPVLDIIRKRKTLSRIWIIIMVPIPFTFSRDKEEKRTENTIRKIDQNKSSRKEDIDRKRKRIPRYIENLQINYVANEQYK